MLQPGKIIAVVNCSLICLFKGLPVKSIKFSKSKYLLTVGALLFNYAFAQAVKLSDSTLSDPVQQHKVSPHQFADTTLIQPNRLFAETPESRSVAVGSQIQASVGGCSIMQRYMVRTNTDFPSTMYLFKYRAALMGAKRLVVIHHSEIDGSEFAGTYDTSNLILREGTSLQGTRYFTKLIADLYDCPK